jgi:DNA-binding NtrC family response regulator
LAKLKKENGRELMKSLNVLVIEESGKNSLNMVLTCWGHVPTFFLQLLLKAYSNYKKRLKNLKAVIIDYPLSQDDLDLLNTLLAHHNIPVYLLTPTVGIQHAMVTLHQGMIDYKPVLAWLTTIEKKERVFQDNKLFTSCMLVTQ